MIEKYNFNDTEAIHPLFQALENCRGIGQDPKWHPEGDVFNHSFQVFTWAFKEGAGDMDLLMAALLHDVGKLVNSKQHTLWSLRILEKGITPKTYWLIEHHMRIKLYLDGIMKRASKVTALVNNPWFLDLVRLNRWDYLGRDPNVDLYYSRVIIIDTLKEISG